MNGQSVGHQGYIPATLVSPARQPMPSMNNATHPRTDPSSYPTTRENSFPTMPTPGCSPYGSNASSASSSVSEFGFSNQEYQPAASVGHSNEYNWFRSPATSGYAGVNSPPAIGQRSQVDDLPRASAQQTTNASNTSGVEYYNAGYYAAFY